MLKPLAQEPRFEDHSSPSMSLSYFSPGSLGHGGSKLLFIWDVSHPWVTPRGRAPLHSNHRSQSGSPLPFLCPGCSPAPAASPSPGHSEASLSTHACGFLPFAFLSLPVSSHPSLSARFSHPGFLWHLSIVPIHLTVQIKPSVFLGCLLLQPNKDFPLKSTHS